LKYVADILTAIYRW